MEVLSGFVTLITVTQCHTMSISYTKPLKHPRVTLNPVADDRASLKHVRKVAAVQLLEVRRQFLRAKITLNDLVVKSRTDLAESN